MVNREIKPNNKTKKEIVERFPLRLITPPRACEPLVETDLADSGAQSGSVSSSWLVILPMANCHIFPSQRVWAKALRLQRSCILLAILRKTIEGYLDSVPSLTFNTIKTLSIMHAFHSSRHLQSKWMLYFSHVSMVQVQY